MKIKLIDLFNIKFEQMESKINGEIKIIEAAGNTIKEIKVIGDSLKNAGVFIVYSSNNSDK